MLASRTPGDEGSLVAKSTAVGGKPNRSTEKDANRLMLRSEAKVDGNKRHQIATSSVIEKGSETELAVMLCPAKNALPFRLPGFAIWNGDVEKFLSALPSEPIFDLIVSSPPYNIGKSYESKKALEKYLEWQERVIDLMIPRLKDTGSLCWQVGNFVDNGQIAPLDIEFAPIFKKHGLQLRNRIIWHFGHGLHNKRRFSGRYETVM